MKAARAIMAGVALALASWSAAPAYPKRHPTVKQIEAILAVRGAQATVSTLFDEHMWDYVADQIAKGDPKWLALAPQLAPGTDAGTAEELPIVLALALPRNAAATLAVIDPVNDDGLIGVHSVCGLPFVEGTVPNLPAYKRDAIKAVKRVDDPALAAMKAKCLAMLALPS